MPSADYNWAECFGVCWMRTGGGSRVAEANCYTTQTPPEAVPATAGAEQGCLEEGCLLKVALDQVEV